MVKTGTKLNIIPWLQSELPKITILLALQTDFAHEFQLPAWLLSVNFQEPRSNISGLGLLDSCYS